MTVREESRSVQRFLGADRASGSPFDLLGVPPDDVTPQGVIAALESRLAEVDGHPECRTPAADEVRLALHATAAQLLDPVVRATLAETWAHASVGAWKSQPALPPSMRAATPGRIALEGDAVLAIAMEGGWNARSLQRLMMFAHARGMDAADVAAAVRHLSRPSSVSISHAPAAARPAAQTPRGPGFARTAGPVAGDPPPPLSRPRAFELTPEEIRQQSAARLKIAAGVIGCGTFLVFAAALGVLAALKTQPDEPGSTQPPIADAQPSPNENPGAAKPAEPKRPSDVSKDLTAADAVARQLAAAADRLREDINDAGTQFESAVRHASTSWPRWKTDELALVQDAVIEYLYRAQQETVALRQAARVLTAPVGAVTAGAVAPEAVVPSLWSAGMLSRVLRERDLPAAVGGPARLSLASILGSGADLGDGTFGAGVSRAVSALAPKLAADPNPETWRQWLLGVDLSSTDAASRGRLIAASIDAILLIHPDPLKSAKVMDSISTLTTALTWRADEQTRPWVFRWFDASDVSTPALHAFTASLAAKSGAEGIDPSMVLSAVASAGERSDLRGRYAAAWSDSPGGARSEAVTAWLKAVGEVTSEVKTPSDATGDLRPHVAALVRAVTMSRLSEAAAWLAVGDTSKAGAVIADPSGPARAGASAARVTTDPLGGDNDGAWAVRYLSLGSDGPKRLEMLKQALSADALTALECEVVAAEGVRGLPATVRREARTVVLRHKALPAMVNALLGLAPLLPPTPESSSLIEEVTGAKLPPLRDARWREAVRRSLVERLLELAAGRGEYGVVDTLAMLLGTSYRERLGAFGGAEGLPSEFDGTTLLRLAQTYHERWDKEAERTPPTGKEPATLGQIRQRAAGRMGVASNVVQRFVAEQSATVELMAYVVAAQDASRAEAVSAIITRWEASRRTAKHIFEQILAAEEAMVGLWKLRTQGGEA
ncbi:MAG: hypothetical protein HEQ23_11245 [Tepidisphaera sp.]